MFICIYVFISFISISVSNLSPSVAKRWLADGFALLRRFFGSVLVHGVR